MNIRELLEKTATADLENQNKNKKYDVISYDVLGNDEDGWEVNNKFKTSDTITLSADATDDEIVKSLVKAGVVKKGTKVYIDGDGQDVFYMVNGKNNKPIGELQLHEGQKTIPQFSQTKRDIVEKLLAAAVGGDMGRKADKTDLYRLAAKEIQTLRKQLVAMGVRPIGETIEADTTKTINDSAVNTCSKYQLSTKTCKTGCPAAKVKAGDICPLHDKVQTSCPCFK